MSNQKLSRRRVIGIDRLEPSVFLRLRIKFERTQRGWSQAYLADLLSVHPTTIAKIEAGDREVKISELDAMADTFDLSVDALLGRSA